MRKLALLGAGLAWPLRTRSFAIGERTVLSLMFGSIDHFFSTNVDERKSVHT